MVDNGGGLLTTEGVLNTDASLKTFGVNITVMSMYLKLYIINLIRLIGSQHIYNNGLGRAISYDND